VLRQGVRRCDGRELLFFLLATAELEFTLGKSRAKLEQGRHTTYTSLLQEFAPESTLCGARIPRWREWPSAARQQLRLNFVDAHDSMCNGFSLCTSNQLRGANDVARDRNLPRNWSSY
jgi:hypothetical protein